METIEIGAVRLDDGLDVVDEFDEFVRPVGIPRLSSFCKKLTSISQEQVDAADTFPVVLDRFLQWAGREPFRLVSWGPFDVSQIQMDCQRHGIAFPEVLAAVHLNLKTAFGRWKDVKRPGMSDALEILGLPHTGTPHRGIDDARNIARIAQAVLPHLPP